jgi:xanthine dehydrogenase accessory factor
VVVEPAPDLAGLEALAAQVKAGRRVRRRIDLRDASVALGEVGEQDAVHWDGQQLVTLHGPHRRLLIIGAGQIAQYLVPLAQALNYEVTVCDPREEYAREWSMDGCRLTTGMPDDVVIDMALNSNSAVLALTHDPKLDDMALLEALKSPAFYVGAVGSRANQKRRRERLLEHFDLSAEQLDRLHGPVGLPIDSRTPPEIAVAILAELVAVSHGVILQRINAARSPMVDACAP